MPQIQQFSLDQETKYVIINNIYSDWPAIIIAHVLCSMFKLFTIDQA